MGQEVPKEPRERGGEVLSMGTLLERILGQARPAASAASLAKTALLGLRESC
jgi:hypothetical protein